MIDLMISSWGENIIKVGKGDISGSFGNSNIKEGFEVWKSGSKSHHRTAESSVSSWK